MIPCHVGHNRPTTLITFVQFGHDGRTIILFVRSRHVHGIVFLGWKSDHPTTISSRRFTPDTTSTPFLRSIRILFRWLRWFGGCRRHVFCWCWCWYCRTVSIYPSIYLVVPDLFVPLYGVVFLLILASLVLWVVVVVMSVQYLRLEDKRYKHTDF